MKLLSGFSPNFRSPFSNIFQGLKLLVKDLKASQDDGTDKPSTEGLIDPAWEWQETVNSVLGAWRDTMDIFDDMKICEIFEEKGIQLEQETVHVLSFIQETSNQLLNQAKEEMVHMDVLCGPLPDMDLEGVMFQVDKKKLSSALRAIISNMIASSAKNSVLMINVKKLFAGPVDQKFTDNAGLDRVRIEIKNEKMNSSAYSFGDNSLFGTSAHFTSATDNDTGLGLWIASSTIREHPNGVVGLEKKTNATNPKFSSFCIYIELPATYSDPMTDQSRSLSSQRSKTKESATPQFDSEALTKSLMRLRAIRNNDEKFVPPEGIEEMPSAEDSDEQRPRESSLTPDGAVDAPAVPSPTLEESKSGPLVKLFNFTRVLVVDDAPLVVKMTVRVLKTMNIASEYITSLSGGEAIQIVEESMRNLPEKKIDAVFLDYVMPVVNGPMVASMIRKIGYTGLVIGVTALAEADDQEVFISNGADIVVVKPLQPATVQAALDTLLNRLDNSTK